ncbi:ABC transporter substrate-binding protein [Sulfurimonas sp.]|uniref:ABC transporter substrate-binding protein n=1 Tax=Sulfurimonas sp. TaxID=2022749 RepID=UPI003569E350
MKFFLFFILFSISLYASTSKISLQLQWKNQFQFAGYYIAKEKGFYKDAGLEVDIKEYKKNMDVVSEVLSGNSTYGIGRSSLIIERNSAKPIVVFGAAFQRSPLVLITTDPKIKDITDLKNKKIMITNDAKKSASILAMLLSNGIDKDDYTIQSHSFNYNDLINKKTDSMASYISNEAYLLDKKNVKYNIFDPAEYGFDFYEDLLFTSEKEMKENPQRLKAFREATVKGWIWAYKNIEESSKIIFDKYNTQNKSLDSLIHEGYSLKKFSMIKEIPFFSVNKEKIKSIAKVFQLRGMMNGGCDVDKFVYEFKRDIKIGVLAKRGAKETLRRWSSLAKYLNNELEYYNFKIVPLSFSEMQNSVRDKKIDFVITNTMYYVILEAKFGVSRIATLVNSDKFNRYELKQFGGVIFTKSTNKKINNILDIQNKTFGAVSRLSFGGWIMAYEEMLKNDIDVDDLELKFLGTHDAVVNAVLEGSIDVGTVRTDTLERMQNEGKIKLSDIKVISPVEYDDFPYLVSTKLYPEWPIAKLKHTSDYLSNKLLAKLVSYEATEDDINSNNIKGWTVPLDYSSVHTVLKDLRLEPYENIHVHFEDIVKEYATYLYLFGVISLLLIARLFYDYKYSRQLDSTVKEKTKELIEVNKKLKVLANQDFLTGISNRAHFMKFATKYFEIARRNNGELQMLSLDLDYFKNINDTYGHQAGDCVLIKFTDKVSSLLRKSDLFGRVGGEEFCIVLQNTSLEGAKMFAKRICESVEDLQMDCEEHLLSITVSIGISSLTDEELVEDLIKKSDIALYEAKDKGRNQVRVYREN